MRSTMYLGALVVLFAALAGAREGPGIGAAPAPGPAGMHHKKHHPWAMAPGPAGMERAHDSMTDADLLFIISADQAEFTDTNTLQLTGVTTTVQYHDTYKHGATGGIIRTPAFVNTTAGSKYVSANGQWLNGPDAALYGDANSSDAATAVLLTLSNPVFDAATQSVRFTVSVLLAEESGLKLHRGVVNGLVMSEKDGKNGTPLVTAVQPGAALTNVALFIDSNKASMQPAAATEDWWNNWGGGGWNGGGWNGGGWNNGWNRGWGGGWGGGSGISINVGR